jgi:hypothetical protein
MPNVVQVISDEEHLAHLNKCTSFIYFEDHFDQFDPVGLKSFYDDENGTAEEHGKAWLANRCMVMGNRFDIEDYTVIKGITATIKISIEAEDKSIVSLAQQMP